MDRIRIFSTVGSQQFQFNRLIKALDQLGLNRKYEIFVQIGYSTYTPSNINFVKFMDRKMFEEHIKECDIVITHAGTGSIISSLRIGKPVIAIPRLKKYGEHVDNHQLEILNIFSSKNYLLGLTDINELEPLISKASKHKFSKYISNTDNFISNLREIIEEK